MNIEFICCFEGAFDECQNGLNRIDEDRIIVDGVKSLKDISLKEKTTIESINFPFRCNSDNVIKEKGIFFIGGWNNDIQIYRSDNYECLSTKYDVLNNYIVGH